MVLDFHSICTDRKWREFRLSFAERKLPAEAYLEFWSFWFYKVSLEMKSERNVLRRLLRNSLSDKCI